MTIDIIHQHTNTLPSGFKITFTVGRIVKDCTCGAACQDIGGGRCRYEKANPHSLSASQPQAAMPHGVSPSAPCGSPSQVHL